MAFGLTTSKSQYPMWLVATTLGSSTPKDEWKIFPAVEAASLSRHCSRQVGFSTATFQCRIRNRYGSDHDFNFWIKVKDLSSWSQHFQQRLSIPPFLIVANVISLLAGWFYVLFLGSFRIKTASSGLLTSLRAYIPTEFLSVLNR